MSTSDPPAPDDHDQRLKVLLRDFLPEFFALFFPDWADRFDFAGAEFLEREAFLDPPQGEKRLLDLVAKLPTREAVPDPSGRAAEYWLVVVHVEVESADRAADLRPRMWQYYDSCGDSTDSRSSRFVCSSGWG